MATWSPLQSDKEEIRLLILKGAQDLTDPITCDLKTVSLQDEPEYEALSYVWGACSQNRSIQLSGANHPVTDNLFYALRTL